MLVIRKLDNHNFVLASKLDTQKIVMIGDKEVIYNYKNEDKYYGNLYEAIKGFIRHNKINTDVIIPIEYKKIKPYSNDSLYMPFLEVGNILETIVNQK